MVDKEVDKVVNKVVGEDEANADERTAAAVQLERRSVLYICVYKVISVLPCAPPRCSADRKYV